MSALVAGVRETTGHLSGRQTAADTSPATDASLATCAGHQPSGRRSFRKQRTVNPPTAPARYNFLYSSSRQQAGVASYSETEPRACEARGSEL
jgi:hypothetical protein